MHIALVNFSQPLYTFVNLNRVDNIYERKKLFNVVRSAKAA